MRALLFLFLLLFMFPMSALAKDIYLTSAAVYINLPGNPADYKTTTSSSTWFNFPGDPREIPASSSKIYNRIGSSSFQEVYFLHRKLGVLWGIWSGDILDISYENLQSHKTCTLRVDSSETASTYDDNGTYYTGEIPTVLTYIGSKIKITGDCRIKQQYASRETKDFPGENFQEIFEINVD